MRGGCGCARRVNVNMTDEPVLGLRGLVGRGLIMGVSTAAGTLVFSRVHDRALKR